MNIAQYTVPKICHNSLAYCACLSVCPQIDVSPVTALKLLLELPPNTVNNTQRLSLLTRAFSVVNSSAMAISTEFVEVHKNQHPFLHTKYQ